MIREDFVAHLPALLRIERACFARPQWGADHFLRDLPGKWELSALLMEHGAVAGFVVASEVVAGSCHLHRMAVLPEMQGRGLGGAAVRALERRAAARGLRMVTLELDAEHGDTEPFYRRLGYLLLQTAERETYGKAKGKALRPDRRIMSASIRSGDT